MGVRIFSTVGSPTKESSLGDMVMTQEAGEKLGFEDWLRELVWRNLV